MCGHWPLLASGGGSGGDQISNHYHRNHHRQRKRGKDSLVEVMVVVVMNKMRDTTATALTTQLNFELSSAVRENDKQTETVREVFRDRLVVVVVVFVDGGQRVS